MSEFLGEPSELKSEKVYVTKKRESGPSSFYAVLGALIGYLSFLGIIYGVLSFSRPTYIEIAFENIPALVFLVSGVGVFMIVFTVQLASLGRSTFAKVTEPGSGFNLSSSLSSIASTSLSSIASLALHFGGMELASSDGPNTKNDVELTKEGGFTYGAASNESSFESYISNVLKSISAYAGVAEITATKLLDKGVAFMAGGIVFYIVAIVIWQVFANLTHPDPNVMYVGMAACSMTFIVVEFLAAWFFKQYRYYVEVSLSCLRVRSVYDRYLLNYYSLHEFKGDEAEKARIQMTEFLKVDVGWPTHKDGTANDFNYMVESMSAAYATLDKMKGVFNSKKKSQSKAGDV
ncbi:hypothetical protein HX785_25145 [Pseudomonas reactans]|uniref:hypothetical protein n=1 Tax=Pseudomonas reactans TaxID=117680 RepID=UPI0015A234F2|nr:hypothetical protein [Pseudomonas reactans]NWF16990.1 hypothetical protein [Pseudomonas reactans]